MAKFRKKPTEVEAFQWSPEMGRCGGVECDADGYYVATVHDQRTLVEADDWIITEPDGVHHYPCKPDIFVERYEAIEV